MKGRRCPGDYHPVFLNMALTSFHIQIVSGSSCSIFFAQRVKGPPVSHYVWSIIDRPLAFFSLEWLSTCIVCLVGSRRWVIRQGTPLARSEAFGFCHGNATVAVSSSNSSSSTSIKRSGNPIRRLEHTRSAYGPGVFSRHGSMILSP